MRATGCNNPLLVDQEKGKVEFLGLVCLRLRQEWGD